MNANNYDFENKIIFVNYSSFNIYTYIVEILQQECYGDKPTVLCSNSVFFLEPQDHTLRSSKDSNRGN